MNSILILILSVMGFFIAGYVWKKKSKKEKLVCFIGKDCNQVIKSRHAETFGIENTVLGMLYYVVMIILMLIAIFYPSAFSSVTFPLALFFIGSLSVLFSVYLSVIQIFVLKELCEYCLINALIVVVIFVLII